MPCQRIMICRGFKASPRSSSKSCAAPKSPVSEQALPSFLFPVLPERLSGLPPPPRFRRSCLSPTSPRTLQFPSALPTSSLFLQRGVPFKELGLLFTRRLELRWRRRCPQSGLGSEAVGETPRGSLNKRAFIELLRVLGRKCLGRECLKACGMLGTTCWWAWAVSIERPLYLVPVGERY